MKIIIFLLILLNIIGIWFLWPYIPTDRSPLEYVSISIGSILGIFSINIIIIDIIENI